ncbi:MAG TPA: type II toxin-antitoxin system RelE/ParE family toxin [Verrucomicrobiae bacterium]|nr:type II toxin-antitoxin system RelE/ParE family toxin [Verrucomicrobiae bacterium]
MQVVLRTSRANLDLVEIAFRIAQENPVAAERWLDKISEKCEMLVRMPKIGRSRPDLAPGFRSFPVGDYVIFYIFYRPISDGIQVIRVLHGARDIHKLFD